MFIIFRDLLMVDQISLSPQVKRSLIISNKLVYIRVASRVTERLKTQDVRKLENFTKISKISEHSRSFQSDHEIISNPPKQTPSSQIPSKAACNPTKRGLWHRCVPANFCEISKKTFSYKAPPVAASESDIFSNVLLIMKIDFSKVMLYNPGSIKILQVKALDKI